jgi:hypothetical protein
MALCHAEEGSRRAEPHTPRTEQGGRHCSCCLSSGAAKILTRCAVRVCAPQEHFDTVESCREFLDEQRVEFEHNDSLAVLQTLVRRRQRRIANRTTPVAAQRALFTESATALSIARVIDILNQDHEEDVVLWKKAKGVIENVSPDIVKLKHEIGSDARCRGNVVNGTCRKCRRDVAGVLSYGFDMIIEDMENRATKLAFKGSQSAGETLFGMSAMAFSALSADAKADAIESVEGMPYNFGVQLIIKEQGGDVLKLAHSVEALPKSALN